MNKPPYDINDEMINIIAQITEKIGKLEESKKIENNLHLRKENRIKTIKSTTAIENNTLSLSQVTDVLNGKRVIGNTLEITEVKNAFTAYEKISEYDPYKIESFLKAHSYITESLIADSGKFRSGDVGVFDGDKVVHMGARPQFIFDLVQDLFDWARMTAAHPLIVSAVVHYEIEYIHPFDDGNGRIGRLWQTTILSKWKKVFEYIPIETIVHKYQEEYYNAIASSKADGKADKFIVFMLEAIDEALSEVDDIEITDIITDIVTDKLSSAEIKVLLPIVKYLLKNDFLDNDRAQILTDRGAESVKKHLSKLTKLNILISVGENKGRKYKLNSEVLK
jgi:Uncharacterized conserved protein